MDDPLARLWQQFKDVNVERLAVLERAAEEDGRGTLSEDARREAQREAHRLAGSMGIFGSDDGPRLGREVERLFGQAADRDGLASLVAELRQELERMIAGPIPASLAEAISSPGSTAPTAGVGDGGGRAGPARILVADDDPSIGRLLERALSRVGYAVTLASNGEEALELAAAGDFDLILLDVQMPRRDGLSACRAIRTELSLGQVPIVMLTASGDERTVTAALEAGANDYLAKPFVVADIRERLQTWLREAE